MSDNTHPQEDDHIQQDELYQEGEEIDLDDLPVSDDDYDPALENIRRGFSLKKAMRDAPSVVFSLVVHGVLIAMLGILYLPAIVSFKPDLTANMEEVEDLENIEMFEDEPLKEMNLEVSDVAPIESDLTPVDTHMEIADTPPKMEVATTDFSDIMAPQAMMTNMGDMAGSDLGGRKNRGTAVAQGGGSEASERAVAMALAWIADHQLPNGAWSYTQLRNPNCKGKCNDAPLDKANKSLVSATAMALLPMLGSGETHKDGKKYKNTVKDGLAYMTSNLQITPNGIILAEKGANPVMYHHGLATIVICEAAAMTRDKQLEKIAQGAVNYIAYAQDPVGGGWRYTPKQPGDTSGMGWNFMALKSAQMAYLNVPLLTVKKSKHFLDNVVGYNNKDSAGAVDKAFYGYTSNDPKENTSPRPSLTAIGLLGQMYMGMKQDNPALIKGTDFLARSGPSLGNLYYSYYATQVMHHVGGEKWDKWNKKMRDGLVSRQVTEGHEKGSWPLETGHTGDSGGRIMTTAFGAMILEVYYRHLPLYRKNSTVDAFPLE